MSRNSRGFRNNNPGNLVKTAIKWQGKTAGTDPRFETFISLQYGIRALLRDLSTKIGKGKNTIRKILTVYAPSFENNTAAYIDFVSKRTGFGPDQVLIANRDTISKLSHAIVIKENGSGITEAELNSAWEIFGQKKK